MSENGSRDWAVPRIAVVRDGDTIRTADGNEYVMNAYSATARREVDRLTGELAAAVAALELLDGEEADDPTPQQILDLHMPTDYGTCTIREHLVELVSMVWDKREYFSGKRPWGESDWPWDFYHPMIDAGFLTAELTSVGSETLSKDERRKGDRLIADAIRALAGGGSPA